MSSQMKGKIEIKNWIVWALENELRDPDDDYTVCLDVGACDGVWYDLLHEHFCSMDAVEVWKPNIEKHHLEDKYDDVFYVDIREFKYTFKYDLIIFGDILEHMSVEDAQKVLEEAFDWAKDIIVAVPFRWPQDAIYGNPYEKHVQDDLTHEIFMERYPGFEPLMLYDNYGYYHKGPVR